MKKFILLSLLIGGSAYTMNQETPEQQLRKIEVALQILNTPEDILRWRCPGCGTVGGITGRGKVYCNSCKEEFSTGSLDQELKDRAGYTLVRLMHLLPKPDKK